MENLTLTSSAFEGGGEIPRECGYNNGNVSPPLTIGRIPYGTKSLALIMDDPDAMNVIGKDGKKCFTEPYVHWVLYNLHPFKGLKFEDTKNFSARRIEIPKSKTTSIPPLTTIDWDLAKSPAEFKKNRNVLSQRMKDQYGESLSMAGVNDFGEFAYGGPAPPDKKHTYFFRLYAVDFGGFQAYARNPEDPVSGTKPTKRLSPMLTKNDLMKKIKGHILDQVTLTGTYAP